MLIRCLTNQCDPICATAAVNYYIINSFSSYQKNSLRSCNGSLHQYVRYLANYFEYFFDLQSKKGSLNNTSETPLQHIQLQSAVFLHRLQEGRWHRRFQSFSGNLSVGRRSAGTRARQPRNLWVSFSLTRSLPAVSRNCCAKSQGKKVCQEISHFNTLSLHSQKRRVIFFFSLHQKMTHYVGGKFRRKRNKTGRKH